LAYFLLILKNGPLIIGSWGYFDIKNPLSLTCFFFLCKFWSNRFSFCVFFLCFLIFSLKY
jgi:hypothetical protein